MPNLRSLLILGCCWLSATAWTTRAATVQVAEESRVTVESGGWQLVGDLMLPAPGTPSGAVLMLNKAAGNRTIYRGLASELAARGVASLRLDLRGHGESTNLGRFQPGEVPRNPLIWDAESDVAAALRYLKGHPRIDGLRIAVVGASYSGEEMAEAGRRQGYERAYVVLSPGSFSQESIAGIDRSGVPWLFVVSRDEPYLQEIRAEVQARSESVELSVLPGSRHASDLLEEFPDLAERLAVWLAHHLLADPDGSGPH